MQLTQKMPPRTFRRMGQMRLWVCEGPDNGAKYDINLEEKRFIKGGREAVNDFVLTDRHVSGFHFELIPTEHGVLLRDLASMNGVYLDRHRIREAWIEPGATFSVGNTKIQLGATEDIEVFGGFEGLIGDSTVMRALVARIAKFAQISNPRVLILGATGTGKELVARALHRRSDRATGPFIARDCTTINGELAESTLFGHKRGAFTGAVTDVPGCFEEADRGTLFLDEIGDLPLALQPKLLRVLQEGEVVRVGEQRPRKVDVQVISATHRDLKAMVSEQRFRMDLWHRISALKIKTPPLNQREGDVLLLADAFLAQLARAHGATRCLRDDARRALEVHSWPGNIRELRNVIEAAYWMTDHEWITAADLDLDLIVEDRLPNGATEWFLRPWDAAVREFERAYFSQLLPARGESRGNHAVRQPRGAATTPRKVATSRVRATSRAGLNASRMPLPWRWGTTTASSRPSS